MAKTSSVSDVGRLLPPSHNTVFVDTNLDTHFAMIVSYFDTVSDLKKKIILEHSLCFRDIGEIKIHALMVKRRGNFYHLSDTMLVKSAFHGVKKNWFLTVDASNLLYQKENQLSCNPHFNNLLVCPSYTIPAGADCLLGDSPSKKQPSPNNSSLHGPGAIVREVLKDLEMENHIGGDQCNTSSCDTNKRLGFETRDKYNLTSDQGEVLYLNSESKDYSEKGKSNQGDSSNHAPESGPIAKKKHKTKKKNRSVEKGHSFENANDKPEQDSLFLQISSAIPCKEVSNDKVKGNSRISDEPCFSSGEHKRLHPGKGTEGPGTHVESKNEKEKDKVVDKMFDSSLEDGSEVIAAKNKQQQSEKENGMNDHFTEKDVNFRATKESLGVDILSSGVYLEEAQKGEKIADNEIINGEQNVELVSRSPISKKKKHKKKSSHNQLSSVTPSANDVTEETHREVTGVPSANFVTEENSERTVGIPFVDDVTMGTSKEAVENTHKDSGIDSDARIVIGRVQVGKECEPSSIPLKGKNLDSSGSERDGIKAPSSVDVQMTDAKSCFVASKDNTLDMPAISEKTRSKRRKSSRAVEEKMDPTPVGENHKAAIHNKQPSNLTAIVSEKRKPSRQEDIDLNNKELVASRLLDGGDVGKSAAKSANKRKIKEPKKLVEGEQVLPEAGDAKTHLSLTQLHEASNGVRATNEVKREEINRTSHSEKVVGTEVEVENASQLDPDGEAPNPNENAAEFSQQSQLGSILESPTIIAGNERKKATKKRKSDGENLTEVRVEDSGQDVKERKYKVNTASMAGKEEKKAKKKRKIEGENLQGGQIEDGAGHVVGVEAVPDTIKKINSAETSTKSQSCGSNLEIQKEHGIDFGSLTQNDDPSLIKGRHLPADFDGNGLTSCNTDEGNKVLEVSLPGSDKAKNIANNSMLNQCRNEVASSAEPCGEKASKTNKSRKRSKKLDSSSTETSLVSQILSKSNVKPGNQSRKADINSKAIEGSLFKDESGNFKPQSDRKLSEENLSESPMEVNKSGSDLKEGRRHKIVKATGGNNSSHLPSKKESAIFGALKHQSHFDCSKGTKASSRNGDDVDGSNHGKSLFAISGDIFSDNNTESESLEDDGIDNSGSSTRTPSDGSASDDSEVDDKENPGFHNAAGKDNGDKSVGKPHYSTLKNASLDRVLRSSSRYKKAKIAASQHEESESQPVDFVPDSQAGL